MSFLPKDARLWFKDVELTLEIIEKCFEKVEGNFQEIIAKSGGIQVISDPTQLFETRKGFLKLIKEFGIVEFGRRFHFKAEKILLQAKLQPAFNKDFKRLADNLRENQGLHYTNVITADSPKQLERLATIFDEIDRNVRFQPLNISLREGYVDEQMKLVCYTGPPDF